MIYLNVSIHHPNPRCMFHNTIEFKLKYYNFYNRRIVERMSPICSYELKLLRCISV